MTRSEMWRLGCRACCFWLAMACLLRPALCQNPQGALAGTVRDSSGAAIAGAEIAVRDSRLALQRTTHSDAGGEFRIEELPPAVYELVVSAPGFAEASSNVTVAVSSAKGVIITLHAASLNEKVLVHATQSIAEEQLDSTSAVHQAVIYRHDLDTIPLAARSFANVAYLAPGAEPVEPSDPTKARVTAVSTGGSSGLNNEISVDGGDNSDDYIGGFLQNFSTDAIEEFAFRTAQADADTGRTTAGSVVITTRIGTNSWAAELSVSSARRRLMRAYRSTTRHRTPNSHSLARTTLARWAARWLRTNCGFSLRSRKSTRTPASLIVPLA